MSSIAMAFTKSAVVIGKRPLKNGILLFQAYCWQGSSQGCALIAPGRHSLNADRLTSPVGTTPGTNPLVALRASV